MRTAPRLPRLRRAAAQSGAAALRTVWSDASGNRQRRDPRVELEGFAREWRAAGAEAASRESATLNALVGAGARLESLFDRARESPVGKLVAPKHVQMNSWAPAPAADPPLWPPGAGAQSSDGGLTDSVLADVTQRSQQRGAAATRRRRGPADKRVEGVAINKIETQLVAVGEPKNSSEQGIWALLHELFFTRQFLTTQQQATNALYDVQPDFHEPTFLHDVQHSLLPAFLDAFWSRDVDSLQRMTSEACLHLDILPHLKQYEGLAPRCRLLFPHSASLFNRMMFVDDSDFAASLRSQAAAESSGDPLGDLDADDCQPHPEPVLVCCVHACVINCWVDPKAAIVKAMKGPLSRAQRGRGAPSTTSAGMPVRIGDPERPENWVFILGLTPEPKGMWSMNILSFSRLEAMSDE